MHDLDDRRRLHGRVGDDGDLPARVLSRPRKKQVVSGGLETLPRSRAFARVLVFVADSATALRVKPRDDANLPARLRVYAAEHFGDGLAVDVGQLHAEQAGEGGREIHH